ncbi:MAG TPA: hypothetical protein VN513_08795 [Gemmatimonadales bacterium]|nr:hypothetical protein [Gemmatimonadales bacterium]
MSDETVRPALTAEEWERLACEAPNERVALWTDESNAPILVIRHRTEDGATMVGSRQLHQAAALALHGQPFGFTRDDVRLLRGVAGDYEVPGGYLQGGRELLDIADRIAALLPPEGLRLPVHVFKGLAAQIMIAEDERRTTETQASHAHREARMTTQREKIETVARAIEAHILSVVTHPTHDGKAEIEFSREILADAIERMLSPMSDPFEGGRG